MTILVVAGCGGGGKTEASQVVQGPGYRFAAPAGWTVKREPHVVSALLPGSDVDLVSVSRYRLPKVPTAGEIDAAARLLARSLGGKISSQGVAQVAGRVAPKYEIEYSRAGADRGVRLIFFLRRRLEFQLLCRWIAPPAKETSRACTELATSFTPAPRVS